jgi:hypothetical protein
MLDVVKICKIHGELTAEKAYYRKNRDKYECRECMRLSEKNRPKREYKGSFAEYHRNHAKEWRRQNSAALNEKIREDRKNNPEKYREWERNKRYKDVEKSRYLDVLKKHKITSSDYENMFNSQDGVCAICNKEEVRLSRNGVTITRLVIDHCHSTNKIRGLLCHLCNTAIGKFKDNIELLQAAIRYLKEHE